MATIRKLFSNESVEDLEKENLGLEGKSLQHTKSIREMEKSKTKITNELELMWNLDDDRKRKELMKKEEALQKKITKEDAVRNMIDIQIIVNGSIIHEKRNHAKLPERLRTILPKLYKIKKNINTKNAEKKHYELIALAGHDPNMNVPDGKRYDEEHLTSIGITGGKSAKNTRKSRKNNGKTQKSRR